VSVFAILSARTKNLVVILTTVLSTTRCFASTQHGVILQCGLSLLAQLSFGAAEKTLDVLSVASNHQNAADSAKPDV